MGKVMIKLFILFWEQLAQTFLTVRGQNINFGVRHKLRPDLEVFPTHPRTDVFLASASRFLTAYHKGNEFYIIVASFPVNTYDETGVTILTRENGRLSSVKNRLQVDDIIIKPQEPQVVPDGIFDVPVFVIPGGKYLSKDPGLLELYEGFDEKPLKRHSLVAAEEGVQYCSVVWVNGKDFLVAKKAKKNYGLKYFKHLGEFKWEEVTDFSNSRTFKKRDFCDMVLYKNIWESFDAIFAFEKDRGLVLMWTEDETGGPGNWENPAQIKTETLDVITMILNLQLHDLNLDGDLDLVVCVEPFGGEIRAYEKPFNNTDFRNVSNYEMHTLITNYRQKKEINVPRIIKVFTPIARNYEGKPWILISGEMLGTINYLVPDDNDPLHWGYTTNKIIGSDQVAGIEVVDYDNDGFNDFMVSYPSHKVLNVYTLKNVTLVPPPPTTPTPSTTLQTQSSSAPKGSPGCLEFVLLLLLIVVLALSCFFCHFYDYFSDLLTKKVVVPTKDES